MKYVADVVSFQMHKVVTSRK